MYKILNAFNAAHHAHRRKYIAETFIRQLILTHFIQRFFSIIQIPKLLLLLLLLSKPLVCR